MLELSTQQDALYEAIGKEIVEKVGPEGVTIKTTPEEINKNGRSLLIQSEKN